MPKQPISAQFYSYNKNKDGTPYFIHFSDGLPAFEGRLKTCGTVWIWSLYCPHIIQIIRYKPSMASLKSNKLSFNMKKPLIRMVIGISGFGFYCQLDSDSKPLVDGIFPVMRSSNSTAMRSARPNALNTVSA